MVKPSKPFAKRPDTLVQDKRVGKKLEVVTNHVRLHLAQHPLRLHLYRFEFCSANPKAITCPPREVYDAQFGRIMSQIEREPAASIIYNGFRGFWAHSEIPFPSSLIEGKRGEPDVEIFHKLEVIGGGTRKMKPSDRNVVESIATFRTRQSRYGYCTKYEEHPRISQKVFPKVREPLNVDSAQLYKSVGFGLEVRLGVEFGVHKMARAGHTATVNLHQALCSISGYPLIHYLCDLLLDRHLSQEEYKKRFHEGIAELDAPIAEDILKKMELALSIIRLVYCNGRGSLKYFKLSYFAEAANVEMFEWTKPQGGVVETVTVEEYYWRAFGVKLRYPSLPCVRRKQAVGCRYNVIVYPMEMCFYQENFVDNQKFCSRDVERCWMREAEYSVIEKKRLLEHITAQLPIGNLAPFIDNNDEYMRMYSVEVGKEMLRAKATLLPPPTIVHGNGKAMRRVLEEEERNREKVIVGSVILVHGSNGDRDDEMNNLDSTPYNRLLYAVSQSGQQVYWQDEENRIPYCIETVHWFPTDNAVELKEYIERVMERVESEKMFKNERFVVKPMFFLVFADDFSQGSKSKSRSTYNLIKYICDSVIGVHSQTVLLDTYNQISENPSTCQHTPLLVGKILAKIGTTHRKLERSRAHLPWMKLTDPLAPTLVIGINEDRSTEKTQKEAEIRGESERFVCSLVGNIDTDITQFRSSCAMYDDDVHPRTPWLLAKECLGAFVRNTGTYPAHVVVYWHGLPGEECDERFGAGLSNDRNEFEAVLRNEEHTPTLTFIVATEQQRTTAFPVDAEDGDPEGYLKPGTLIEDVVTSPDHYDFILSTHRSRFTHYWVVYDDWSPMDSFWPAVSHCLTYAFCLSTETTELPAPVIYAKLARERMRGTVDGYRSYQWAKGENFDISKVPHLRLQPVDRLDGMFFV